MISPIGKRRSPNSPPSPYSTKATWRLPPSLFDLRRTSRRAGRRRGYTLIELILLTVIIALIVGISAPQFKNAFMNLELKEAAFNISRLITFAEERAIVDGVVYKFVIDADRGTYYILKPNPEKPDKYIRLKERYGRVFSLPKSVAFKTDKREFLFYPYGKSDEGVIILEGKRKKIKVTVEKRLGYVRIEEKF